MASQTPSTPIQAGDIRSVAEIQALTLSPSGRNVAYTVREPDSSQDAVTYQTNLYVVPAHGRAAPRLLTRAPGDVSEPAWHPDGNQLAFVREVNNTPQVFLLSLSGGEPYQLTDTPYGAGNPQWGPNGNRIVYESSIPEPVLQRRSGGIPPSERPGRSPQDTIQQIPPDTLLVLRHRRTLDRLDTLRLGPDGRPQVPEDTSQQLLTTPDLPSIPDSLREVPIDRLRAVSRDSVRALFEHLHLIPDTTTLPVSMDPPATPDGNLVQVRRWLDRRPSTKPQVFSRLDVRAGGEYRSTPAYQHYFVVDVPRDLRRRTPPRPSPRSVTRGFRSYEAAAWLPGGTQIVVSAPPSVDAHPDRIRDRNLYVVDLQPYRIKRLLDIDGYRLTAPQVTADGTTLAFEVDALSDPYGPSEIGLFELDGRSDPQIVTATFEHDIESLHWSPNGWYLYAVARTRGGRPLYRFAPFARDDTTEQGETSLQDAYSTSRDTFSLDTTMTRTAPHDRMLTPNRAVQAFDVTDSKVIYAALTPDNPSELYGNTVSFRNERRLTSYNEDWLGARELATPTSVTGWNQNAEIHGRLTTPVPFDDSLQYPLITIARGGPSELEAFDPVASWFERQYLAGRGYGVLEVWPRGSSGYGEAFRRRNFQDWGPGPGGDVIAIADSVGSRSWVDSTQQALAGRGYGGYLTAWLLGQTRQFRAGVAQNGVYDLSAFFGDGEAWPVVRAQFGGYPWTPTPETLPDVGFDSQAAPLLSAGLLPPADTTMSPDRALRQNSPITHADRISTPLLLLHGGANHHTGPTQAEMLYRRLKLMGTPTEYVRYPSVTHDFAASAPPHQRVDRLVRLFEFIARFTQPGGTVPSGE